MINREANSTLAKQIFKFCDFGRDPVLVRKVRNNTGKSNPVSSETFDWNGILQNYYRHNNTLEVFDILAVFDELALKRSLRSLFVPLPFPDERRTFIHIPRHNIGKDNDPFKEYAASRMYFRPYAVLSKSTEIKLPRMFDVPDVQMERALRDVMSLQLGCPHAVLLLGTMVATKIQAVQFYYLSGADPVREFNSLQRMIRNRITQLDISRQSGSQFMPRASRLIPN